MKKTSIILLFILITTLLLCQGCRIISSDPTSTSQDRQWTVPFDNSGFIAGYDIRYTVDSSIVWDNWTQVLDEPIPKAIGEIDNYTMSLPEGIWFVAIKSKDAVGNWSDISNIVHVEIDATPPVVITDFQ